VGVRTGKAKKHYCKAPLRRLFPTLTKGRCLLGR